jgi:hypothetical protein
VAKTGEAILESLSGPECGNLWGKGKQPRALRVATLLVRIRLHPRKAVTRRKTNPRILSDQLRLRAETVDQWHEMGRRFHYGRRPQFAEFTLLSG